MGVKKKKDKSQLNAEDLWNKYEPNMRKICEYKLRSCPSEIDDVISQTYLALCIKLSETTLNNPKSWLYATVGNLIKKTYEEQNKNKSRFISLDTGFTDSHNLIYTNDFTEQQFTNDEIDILLAQVLAELSPDELTLINLVYDKHIKYKEIAKMLGTTENAVKQRMYRLKGKIKDISKEKTKNYK